VLRKLLWAFLSHLPSSEFYRFHSLQRGKLKIKNENHINRSGFKPWEDVLKRKNIGVVFSVLRHNLKLIYNGEVMARLLSGSFSRLHFFKRVLF
jgi:hypothetical protein